MDRRYSGGGGYGGQGGSGGGGAYAGHKRRREDEPVDTSKQLLAGLIAIGDPGKVRLLQGAQ